MDRSDLTLTAYTDGSYDKENTRCGYGAVFLDAGGRILNTLYGGFTPREDENGWNVNGEIRAAEEAVKAAIEAGAGHLRIFCDYEGVEKWGTLQWKRNKSYTASYAAFIQEKKRDLDITFAHVKGHSGDRFNQLADEAAALGTRQTDDALHWEKTYQDGRPLPLKAAGAAGIFGETSQEAAVRRPAGRGRLKGSDVLPAEEESTGPAETAGADAPREGKMENKGSRIGVLGAGTWGMALSRMLCNSGHDVTVWSALPQEVEEYARTRRHPNLPGMIIPDGILFTDDIRAAVTEKDVLLFAVPSVFVRQTAAKAAPFIPDGQVIVDVAKGIEPVTHMTMTEVIGDEVRKGGKYGVRLVALSGPTHAEEVARDMPTTIVSSCDDMRSALLAQDVFMNTCMRVYTNPDVRGVELCGAMKNIIALAAGISAGLGYGDNTKAALITRGMAEITRLGLAMGCQEQTFYGLAGIGDLIVTATSVHSRNNRAGFLIGQGRTPEEAVKEVGMVVEGINALPAAMELSADYGVQMPIAAGVDRIVREGADPRAVVRELMEREKKPEVQRG